MIYQVNWNIFGAIDIKASNEDEAREIVENMSNEKIKNMVLNELNNGSFDIGTIEKQN